MSIISQLVGGRSQISLMVNRSGGDLVLGDAVVLDPDNDISYKTSTTQGDATFLGVVLDNTESLANGRVCQGGFVSASIKGAATRGNYIRHSTTAKRLEDAGTTPVAGVCGILLESGTDEILSVYLIPNFGIFNAVSNVNNGVFGITIDGGGSAITTGLKGFVRVPWAGTITKWTLLADQDGDIVIDIWKDSFANYPPDNSDTITASNEPTLSNDNEAEDSTLTGWDTTIAAGDIFGFNVDSADTITRVVLEIEYTKS